MADIICSDFILRIIHNIEATYYEDREIQSEWQHFLKPNCRYHLVRWYIDGTRATQFEGAEVMQISTLHNLDLADTPNNQTVIFTYTHVEGKTTEQMVANVVPLLKELESLSSGWKIKRPNLAVEGEEASGVEVTPLANNAAAINVDVDFAVTTIPSPTLAREINEVDFGVTTITPEIHETLDLDQVDFEHFDWGDWFEEQERPFATETRSVPEEEPQKHHTRNTKLPVTQQRPVTTETRSVSQKDKEPQKRHTRKRKQPVKPKQQKKQRREHASTKNSTSTNEAGRTKGKEKRVETENEEIDRLLVPFFFVFFFNLQFRQNL